MKGLLRGLALVAGMAAAPAMAAGLLLEAESYTATGAGVFKPVDDRPGASGGKALAAWDTKGHWLEWAFEVPKAGEYQVTVRYAGGRKWSVWRELQLDGAVPAPAFGKIVLDSTGGWGRSKDDWSNLTLLSADGKPLTLKLEAGKKHVLRLTNTGSAGDDGGANLDAVMLTLPGVNPETLLQN